jgi:hypothetical protein
MPDRGFAEDDRMTTAYALVLVLTSDHPRLVWEEPVSISSDQYDKLMTYVRAKDLSFIDELR